jgi:hypothetical protein
MAKKMQAKLIGGSFKKGKPSKGAKPGAGINVSKVKNSHPNMSGTTTSAVKSRTMPAGTPTAAKGTPPKAKSSNPTGKAIKALGKDSERNSVMRKVNAMHTASPHAKKASKKATGSKMC